MSRRPLLICGLGILLFLVAIYFPLFLHLDSLSLRLWDEARRGVNALEMARDGHWLVPHFTGAPDNWGTKPPLLIWLQALFFKLLDSPELAVRLPSALAGLATALVLVWAGKRILSRPIAGYAAALVLLTSGLYIEAHGAVAGDYDALLTLWLTLHVLTFFLLIKERQDRWLYLSALFLLLAGWTKGVAAFFFLPGLLLFALTHQSYRWIFTYRKFYVVAWFAFAGILSYYLIRESLYPGYLTLVWDNELGGRYFEAKEGHGWGFGYYFRVINKYQLFFPWQYFLPLGYFLLFREEQTKDLGRLLLINVLVFLLIVSCAATKLNWYVLPLWPLLALVVGHALERLWQGLMQIAGPPSTVYRPPSTVYRLSSTVFFFLAIFASPYITIVQKVYHLQHTGPEREKVRYRDFFRRLPPDQAFTVLLPGYNGHFTFYQQVFRQKGYSISASYLKKPHPQVQAVADTTTHFQPGALVGICEQQAAEFMEKQYRSETVLSWETCKLLRIMEAKNNDQ